MTPEQAFGKTLKELWADRNISQLELSAISTVSRAAISKLQSGQREPSMKFISLLAEALETTPADLINRTANILIKAKSLSSEDLKPKNLE